MADEKPLESGESRGSGTARGYRVQARSRIAPVLSGIKDGSGPKEFILTKDWQEVNPTAGNPGVPAHSLGVAREQGLQDYAGAMALAYWFAAAAPPLTEVRLLQYEVKYTYDTKLIGEGETLDVWRLDGPRGFSILRPETPKASQP